VEYRAIREKHMRRLIALSAVAAASVLATLGGCADVEVRTRSSGASALIEVHRVVPAEEIAPLARAPACCATLAELPFESPPREGPRTVVLDASAPAFEFATGKSFFAAWRLPAARPIEVQVVSRAAAPAAVRLIDPNRKILNPALVVLDAQFNVRRTVQAPDGLTLKVYRPDMQVEGVFEITAPPDDAAYLVLLTTDALRAYTTTIRGVRIDGFTPVGAVDVAIRVLPGVTPPVRFRARATPTASGSAPRFTSQAGELLVHEGGVSFLEEQGGRYVSTFAMPFDRIVSARVEFPLLLAERALVEGVAAPGAPVTLHGFELQRERLDEASSPYTEAERFRGFATLVGQRIEPGWRREPVVVTAAVGSPAVEFLDPPRVPSGAASRIGEQAGSAGLLTAGVCGICQTGLCPPELLLACAGLFAVGAAIGGSLGIASEAIAGGFKAPPQPAGLAAQHVEATAPGVRTASAELLAQEALRECIARRGRDAPVWVDQGRGAVFVAGDAEARYGLEATVTRVALQPRGTPGQPIAEAPVQLLANGEVVFSDRREARTERRSIAWQGPSHTLAEWTAPDAAALRRSLGEACEGLASAALREADGLWRKWR
jgi:hypothetical protein